MFPRADTVREDHRLEIENLDSDASWESDFPDEEEIFVNFNNSGNKNTNSSRSASDSSDPDYNLPSASSSSKKTNKNKRGRKKRGRTVSADGRRRSTAGSKNLAGADGSKQLEHQNMLTNTYLLAINNMIQKSALLLCVKWAGSSIVGVEDVEFTLNIPQIFTPVLSFFSKLIRNEFSSVFTDFRDFSQF